LNALVSQDFFVCDQTLYDAIMAITNAVPAPPAKIIPQQIDNPDANERADEYGIGPVLGKWVVPARVYDDPQLTHYRDLFDGMTGYEFSGTELFLPQPEV
jgi:hypothetical protein